MTSNLTLVPAGRGTVTGMGVSPGLVGTEWTTTDVSRETTLGMELTDL